jgi:hypothetical protein
MWKFTVLILYTPMSYCGTAYVQYGADEGSWGVRRWVSLHTGLRSLLKPPSLNAGRGEVTAVCLPDTEAVPLMRQAFGI